MNHAPSVSTKIVNISASSDALKRSHDSASSDSNEDSPSTCKDNLQISLINCLQKVGSRFKKIKERKIALGTCPKLGDVGNRDCH